MGSCVLRLIDLMLDLTRCHRVQILERRHTHMRTECFLFVDHLRRGGGGVLLFQARLALSIIVGNNKFNASMAAFQKPKSNAGDLSGLEHQHDFEEEQGSSFRQHIHDVFMDSFSRNMLDQVGGCLCVR